MMMQLVKELGDQCCEQHPIGMAHLQAAQRWMIHAECGHRRALAALWMMIYTECGHRQVLAALWWMSRAE